MMNLLNFSRSLLLACICAAGSAHAQSVKSAFNLDARILMHQQLVLNGETVCVAQNSIPGFMKSELHVDVFGKNTMLRTGSFSKLAEIEKYKNAGISGVVHKGNEVLVFQYSLKMSGEAIFFVQIVNLEKGTSKYIDLATTTGSVLNMDSYHMAVNADETHFVVWTATSSQTATGQALLVKSFALADLKETWSQVVDFRQEDDIVQEVVQMKVDSKGRAFMAVRHQKKNAKIKSTFALGTVNLTMVTKQEFIKVSEAGVRRMELPQSNGFLRNTALQLNERSGEVYILGTFVDPTLKLNEAYGTTNGFVQYLTDLENPKVWSQKLIAFENGDLEPNAVAYSDYKTIKIKDGTVDRKFSDAEIVQNPNGGFYFLGYNNVTTLVDTDKYQYEVLNNGPILILSFDQNGALQWKKIVGFHQTWITSKFAESAGVKPVATKNGLSLVYVGQAAAPPVKNIDGGRWQSNTQPNLEDTQLVRIDVTSDTVVRRDVVSTSEFHFHPHLRSAMTDASGENMWLVAKGTKKDVLKVAKRAPVSGQFVYRVQLVKN